MARRRSPGNELERINRVRRAIFMARMANLRYRRMVLRSALQDYLPSDLITEVLYFL